MVQGSLGESVYTVGSAIFPVLNVDEDDVREVFGDKARARVKIPTDESLWLQVAFYFQGFKMVRFEICEKVSRHYYAVLKAGEKSVFASKV